MKKRTYIAIDLKSFYASVECRARGLDPLTTNLVVADASRTEKTICLAVSPSLKSYGISGRARLFEVVQRMREVNVDRRKAAQAAGIPFGKPSRMSDASQVSTESKSPAAQSSQPALASDVSPVSRPAAQSSQPAAEAPDRYQSATNTDLELPDPSASGGSIDGVALAADPGLKAQYIAAVPRMAKYMEVSSQIYHIYLRYVAPEDIHVYSIDEVFMDVTNYLRTYGKSARELAMEMILEVLKETGITATAGIGSNMYLAKIAMDIDAKHIKADSNGVRISELTELSYRQRLWEHQPITDFWRVGRGIARKLASVGLYTMGDIARCSIGKPHEFYNEDLLYKLFGINAELLIDHAWGWEPCTIEEIKAYKPQSRSLGSGQVLHCAYDWEHARIVVREMTDQLALDLVRKNLVADQIVLTVGYDMESLTNPDIRSRYKGEINKDFYGRRVPKHAHGTANLDGFISAGTEIVNATMELYDRIVDPVLLVRRINVVANHIMPALDAPSNKNSQMASASSDSTPSAAEPEQLSLFGNSDEPEQLNFFTDYEERERQREAKQEERKQDKKVQQAILDIKEKFGKNAILKGTNLEEGATMKDRNNQIGGHKA